MKIMEDIYVVGGGIHGIGLSDDLDCNVYLVNCGDELVLIDAGVGVNTERIMENLKRKCINMDRIKRLFLTHAHLDHSGGASFLKEKLNTTLYLSEIEAPFLESGNEEAIGLLKAKECGFYEAKHKLAPVKVDYPLHGWEIFKLGKYNIQAIPTPGHSKGSISYLLTGHEKRILFSGDTVALGGYISIQNLPDSSLADYVVGINNLAGLEIDSLFPSHNGFIINGGQYHINIAVKALAGLVEYRKIITR